MVGARAGGQLPGLETHLRWSRSCSASCWCCSTSARSRCTASLSCEFSSQRAHASLGPGSAAPCGERAWPRPPPSWGERTRERCFQGAPRRTKRRGPQTSRAKPEPGLRPASCSGFGSSQPGSRFSRFESWPHKAGQPRTWLKSKPANHSARFSELLAVSLPREPSLPKQHCFGEADRFLLSPLLSTLCHH